MITRGCFFFGFKIKLLASSLSSVNELMSGISMLGLVA